MTLLKKKPVQLVIVLLLAAGIVLVGTFAWSSFNQSKINVFTELVAPDVNLHDDFEGGPNKDVYVENSGQSNIFLRVRLTEFLQTTVKGSLVEGHVRDDDKAHNWAPHNATLKGVKGTIDSCTLIDPNKNSAAWGTDNFHDYYTWLMGGNTENPTAQIYYLPATTEQKGKYTVDEAGNQVMEREPVVVSNPLTGTSPVGDASLDYKETVNAAIAADTGVAGGTGENDYPDIPADDPKVDELLAAAKKARAMETVGVKETLPGGKIITMSQWIVDEAAPPATRAEETTPPLRKAYAKGDFWVIDEADGWCYWANPLPGGEATSLLLDKVNRTKKTFDSNAEYAINAMLQATDENDLGKFETAEAGTITDNGRKLLQLAAGKIVIGTDGTEYKNNGDGTYTPTANPDGTPITDGKAFIPLGEDDVNVTTKLEIGKRVIIETELAWDGFEYINHAALNVPGAEKLYNLTVSTVTDAANDNGKQIYEVAGTQRGADGQIYLKLSPAGADGTIDTSTVSYIASVKETTVDTAKTYANDYPGTAPYGMLWAGADGVIGNGDDSRFDPTADFETRFFHHIGNGVYLETADKGGTVSKTDPVKYFFAGQYVTKSVIAGAIGDVNAKVDAVFTLQLGVGDKFDVTFGTVTDTNTPVTAYDGTDVTTGAYTMQALEQGVDGKQYLSLGSAEAGYIGTGADGFLGNTGEGKADARRWAGPMGIGTPQDTHKAPEYFSEPFLAGLGYDNMKPGEIFTTPDRNKRTGQPEKWIVLDIDEFGNRLIVQQSWAYTPAFGSSNNYNVSNLKTAMASYYQSNVPTLKPYAMGVNTPVEENKWTKTNSEPGALSTCTGSRAGATAFVLSQSEVIKYAAHMAQADYYPNGSFFTRTPATWGSVSTFTGTSTGFVEKSANGYASTTPMALWIRLSDADRIATPAAVAVANGMPKVGDTVTMGSYPQAQASAATKQPIKWKVLKTEGTKALMVSESGLDVVPYHNTATYVSWKDSNLRSWMNNTFYSTAFTAEERAKLVPTITNSGRFSSDWEKVAPNAPATDNVFALSADQLVEGTRIPALYRSNAERIAAPTAYAKAKGGLKDYWSRSPASLVNVGLANYRIDNIGRQYSIACNAKGVCARPAIWVEYDPAK